MGWFSQSQSQSQVSLWYEKQDEDEDEMPEVLNGQIWDSYTEQIAQSTSSGSSAHCVSCWYEEHSGEPFPAEDTSSLCGRHVQATRTTHRAWWS